mgnify:CR=1 FL=1
MTTEQTWNQLVPQEETSRQALKEAGRLARHTRRQAPKEKPDEETREFIGALLNIFERIADKIRGEKK